MDALESRMPDVDPASFDDASIPADARDVSAMIMELTEDLPNWWDVGAARTRAARARGEGPFPPVAKSPRARMVAIEGPSGTIPVRVIAPERPRGVYLHFHGGGWVLGASDQQDPLLERIADATGLTAVSVEYRLAPENPFPAGPDDCEAAALWLVQHAKREFGTDRLLIGGASAGASLAVTTLVRLRDRSGAARAFAGANLVFGVYDLAGTPSQQRAGVPSYRDLYLPGRSAEERRRPDVSPLYADLAGLPPALFTVGGADPLLDDSLFLALRWAAAGNEAELALYPESLHGFTLFPTAMARAANARIEAWVAARARS
jgi:acetyl esterase